MDTRTYIEYRSRINSTTNEPHLELLVKDLHNLPRDKDKEDLYHQIDIKRAVIQKLAGVKVNHTATLQSKLIV